MYYHPLVNGQLSYLGGTFGRGWLLEWDKTTTSRVLVHFSVLMQPFALVVGGFDPVKSQNGLVRFLGCENPSDWILYITLF